MNIGVGIPTEYMGNFSGNQPLSRFLGFGCPQDYEVTADTKPDCDVFGPDCHWEGKHWIALHQEKVKKYGKAKADADWANDWQSCRGILGAFGHELTIANTDVAFKAYVKQQGLDQLSMDLRTIYGTAAAGQAVVDTGGHLLNTVDNLAKATESTGKGIDTLAKWFPWIVLGGVVLIGFLIYKKGSLNVVA